MGARLNGRGIEYGGLTHEVDRRATADQMEYNAEGYRRYYRNADPGSTEYRKSVAEAAYCQSLADRKRRAEHEGNA